MNVEQIRNDLRDVRIFCSRYFPFVVIPLSYMRVVAAKAVPTAGVDERGVLAVNPEWWLSLKTEARRFVAIHESLHAVLCHPLRMKGFNHEVYNLSADGKVNDAIADARVSGVEFNGGITLNTLATVAGLRVEDLKKMSTEEIARTLEKLGGNGKQGGERGDINGDLLEGEVNGETVQEGDRSVSKAKAREDLKQAWKRLCEKAKAFAKQAGTMPAGLERIVNEVLDVKPPWHITMRFGLRNSSRFDSSYAHPSRRGDDYPGQYGYRYTVYALVDTSGSIMEDELKLFLGIIKHEARQARVYAIPWDADAFEVLKAERPAEVARKIARKMRGGGGTVCLPVLKKVHGLMRGGDAVIFLSDGDIADETQPETQEWFKKVSTKAAFAMIGYTHKPVTAPGFATAHIDFHTPSFGAA